MHNFIIRFSKAMYRLIKLGMTLALFTFCTIILIGNGIIYYQNQQLSPDKNADTIIILGAHIEGTPLRPSLMLQYRLDAAFHYWQTNPDSIIITTGGRTVGLPQSEAEVMAQYLIKQGVPQSAILLEENSTRTAHQFTGAMMLREINNVVIVTNDFHLPRSIMLAKRSGLNTASGIGAQTPQDLGSKTTAFIREPLALLNSWLFDWPE